jgi:hypothetical protein
MKKALTMAGIMAGAFGAFAQGTITWNDAQTGYTIAIISPSTATPTVEVQGANNNDVPSGTTSYTGGWIGNTTGSPGGGIGATPTAGPGTPSLNYQTFGNFEVGLYLDTSLAALTTDIKTGLPVAVLPALGGGNAGLYQTTTTTTADANIVGGTAVFVGIAAWYDVGAASYAASPVHGYVESTVTATLGGAGSPPGTPPGMAGLGITSFSLATSVPEPSTIALGVMGASAFLMRLRRKQ